MRPDGARAEAMPARQDEPDRGQATTPPLNLGVSRHALVVDDEPALLDIVRRIVRRMGWTTDGFGDAHAAIESLEGTPQRYDIVLTDLRLGAETGLEVAAAAVRVRPGLPVILLSGAPLSAATWETAADAGVQMVIYKPFRIDELVEAIRGLTSPRASPPGGRMPVATGMLPA